MIFQLLDYTQQIPPFLPDNPFQSDGFLCLFRGCKHSKAYLATVMADEKLIVAQPIIIHRFIPFLPAALGSYCVANYPPHINHQFDNTTLYQAICFLLTKSCQYLHHKAFYIEFRHFNVHPDIPFDQIFASHKFDKIPWYNCVVDFQSPKQFVANLTRNRRNELRQALNSDATVSTNPTNQQWDEFYNVISAFYKKIHRPFPEKTLFHNLLLNRNIAIPAIISIENRVVGGAILLKSNTCGYTWHYYALKLHNQPNLTLLTIYKLILTLSDSGISRLDFMGAGRQNTHSGIRQFKLSLGGRLVDECRYRRRLIF